MNLVDSPVAVDDVAGELLLGGAFGSEVDCGMGGEESSGISEMGIIF
jgi:hypothetical protein